MLIDVRYSEGRNGTQARICCPYCEDDKYRLYINVDISNPNYGRWLCFHCGAKGGQPKPDWISFQPLPKKLPTQEAEKEIKEENHDEVEFPCRTFRITPMFPEAYHYVTEVRGLTDTDIERYDLRIGCDYYSSRIFFPDRDRHGRLLYWVARSIKPWVKAKYINPHKAKNGAIHYLERVRANHNTVIITEGPISAIKAGSNAVATYGKNISPEQVATLLRANFQEYIIALDGDAGDEAMTLLRTLRSGGATVPLIVMARGEDPDSIGKIEFHRRLQERDRSILERRLEQHRFGVPPGFSEPYLPTTALPKGLLP